MMMIEREMMMMIERERDDDDDDTEREMMMIEREGTELSHAWLLLPSFVVGLSQASSVVDNS
jgi:hypothetical protein